MKTFYLANFNAYKFSQVDYKFLEVRKTHVLYCLLLSAQGSAMLSLKAENCLWFCDLGIWKPVVEAVCGPLAVSMSYL